MTKIVRFGIVGCFNTAFSFGVYALGVYAGLAYYIASLLALISGITLSFFTQGRLVFNAQLEGRFSSFVAVWGLLYLFNVGLIGLMSFAGLDNYTAGLVALPLLIALSFILQNIFVFKNNH